MGRVHMRIPGERYIEGGGLMNREKNTLRQRERRTSPNRFKRHTPKMRDTGRRLEIVTTEARQNEEYVTNPVYFNTVGNVTLAHGQ